jgi:hypothetical protein
MAGSSQANTVKGAKQYNLLCLFAVNYFKARTKMEGIMVIAFDFIKCLYL